MDEGGVGGGGRDDVDRSTEDALQILEAVMTDIERSDPNDTCWPAQAALLRERDVGTVSGSRPDVGCRYEQRGSAPPHRY